MSEILASYHRSCRRGTFFMVATEAPDNCYEAFMGFFLCRKPHEGVIEETLEDGIKVNSIMAAAMFPLIDKHFSYLY